MYSNDADTRPLALRHSLSAENTRRPWQHGNGLVLRNSQILAPMQERSSGATIDFRSTFHSDRGCSSQAVSRAPAPRPRPPCATALRKDNSGTSWAAVAAAGIVGPPRPALPAQESAKSLVDVASHSKVSAELAEGRRARPQIDIPVVAKQQLPTTGDAARATPAATRSSTLPHAAAHDISAEREGPGGRTATPHIGTCRVVTVHEPHREHHTPSAQAQQQQKTCCSVADCSAAAGARMSDAVPFARGQEFSSSSFSKAGETRPSHAAAAGDCVPADSVCSTKSGSSALPRMLTGIDVERSGGTKNGSSCESKSKSWLCRAGEASSSSIQAADGGCQTEHDSELSKLLLPGASTRRGDDACGRDAVSGWASRKQVGSAFFDSQDENGSHRLACLGVIREPLVSKDAAGVVTERHVGTVGGNATSHAQQARNDTAGSRGDSSKSVTSTLAFGLELNEGDNVAATAASREIAFLIEQWPQGHQQQGKPLDSGSQQHASAQREHTCLGEAIGEGESTLGRKVQMGVFTETSRPDESIFAVWLPVVGEASRVCTEQTASCTDPQPPTHSFAKDAALSARAREMTGASSLMGCHLPLEAEAAYAEERGAAAAGATPEETLQKRQEEQRRLPQQPSFQSRGAYAAAGCLSSGGGMHLHLLSGSVASLQGATGNGETDCKATANYNFAQHRLSAEQEHQQQRPWLNSWASKEENGGVLSGTDPVDLREQQLLRRRKLKVENQRSASLHDEGRSSLPHFDSNSLCSNAAKRVSSVHVLGLPTSSLPPPPPTAPPCLAAGAFSSICVLREEEPTGERKSESTVKDEGRTSFQDPNNYGNSSTSLLFIDAFQNERNSFFADIPPPPGLAATTGQQQQQQQQRLEEAKKRTFSISGGPLTLEILQQNRPGFRPSTSGSLQQSCGLERMVRRQCVGGNGPNNHACASKVVDTQRQQQQVSQRLSKEMLSVSETSGIHTSCAAEQQGHDLWEQQQHDGRPAVAWDLTVACNGKTEAALAVESPAKSVGDRTAAISDVQRRTKAHLQHLDAVGDNSATSAVLSVAQRVAAAAALLRREQQRPAVRNTSGIVVTPPEDGKRTAAFGLSNTGSSAQTFLDFSEHFGGGEERQFPMLNKVGITAALLGLQKATTNGVHKATAPRLSTRAWTLSLKEGEHRGNGQRGQLGKSSAGDSGVDITTRLQGGGPKLFQQDSSGQVQHNINNGDVRKCGFLAGVGNTMQGHLLAANRMGEDGGSSRLLQCQQHVQRVRSPSLFLSQHRQQAGRCPARAYAEPVDSQGRHTREGTLRQTIRGIREKILVAAQVRSSSCAPLPSSVSAQEQEDSFHGAVNWEKVDFVVEPQQRQQAFQTGAAEFFSGGGEGSCFVSHEQSGVFSFGGRHGEAGEICSDIRCLQSAGPDKLCWSTLSVFGTPPPPCSGGAVILARRPAAAVGVSSPSSSLPDVCLPGDEPRHCEAAEHRLTAGQKCRDDPAEVLPRAEGSVAQKKGERTSRCEEETFFSDYSSGQKLLQDVFLASDGKISSNSLGTPITGGGTRRQEPSPGAPSQQREAWGEGDSAGVATNDALRIPMTASAKTEVPEIEKLEEQQGSGKSDRRVTLLVYGGRYGGGCVDWENLYECDLAAHQWRCFRVDVSRLPRASSWRAPVAASIRVTPLTVEDKSSYATTAVSCASCTSPFTTKSILSSSTLLPEPPLPGALQESSWCYSELDDSVYVFGGVCREAQLQVLSVEATQQASLHFSQQKQAQSENVQEQHGGADDEKDGEQSSDDVGPRGNEMHGEKTASVLRRRLPPAWQCQNLLWRLDLARLQWTLVDVYAVRKQSSSNKTGGAAGDVPQQHEFLSSSSSQNSLSSGVHAVESPAASESCSVRSANGCSRSDPTRENEVRSNKEDRNEHFFSTYGGSQPKAEGDCSWNFMRACGRGWQSNIGNDPVAPGRTSGTEGEREEDGDTCSAEAHILSLNSSTFATVPKGRAGHSCVYKDKALWVFGGSNTQEELADFFRFDVKQSTWHEIKGGGQGGDAGRRPCARYGHVATILGDFMIIFGGYGGKQAFLADLYTFHFPTYSWIRLAGQGAVPAPRFRCGAWTYGGYFYVFGGRGGMQHIGLQQQNQQQPSRRQWLDSTSYQSGGDGPGVGTGSSCKRSVVFVDAARIQLLIDEMLVSHKQVGSLRGMQQCTGQQPPHPHHQLMFSKPTSSSPSPHRLTGKKELQGSGNECTSRGINEQVFGASQQNIQVANVQSSCIISGKSMISPHSEHGRTTSRERETPEGLQLQTPVYAGISAVVAPTNSSEGSAAADTPPKTTEGDRVSAVATAMLQLVQQQAAQKAAGSACLSRSGERDTTNAGALPLVSENCSRIEATRTPLDLLKMQLNQQRFSSSKDDDDDESQGGGQQQQNGGAESRLFSQYQDLIRVFQARLQDAEQRARTAEFEQRQETYVLQEQIRRVSLTLTTLYNKLWNAASEIARAQKENERLVSDLAAREAIILRQRAALEALTAKYSRAQVEIAFLVKSHQQRLTDGSSGMGGNSNLRGEQKLSSVANAKISSMSRPK